MNLYPGDIIRRVRWPNKCYLVESVVNNIVVVTALENDNATYTFFISDKNKDQWVKLKSFNNTHLLKNEWKVL